MANPNLLLEDYIPLTEAAKQPNMPSIRTLQRMIERRELPVVYFGKRPFLHAQSFRDALRSREIKPITNRRK